MYHNRTALVTGAASGIGKSLVEHLCANGATVVCADITTELGRKVVQSINAPYSSKSGPAHFIHVDVADWLSVRNMFRHSEELLNKTMKGAKLDFVFANAGIAGAPYPDFTGEPDLKGIKVNLIGAIYTIQAAMQYFLANEHPGRIVVTASQVALYPFDGAPIYSASKQGILGFVRAASRRAVRHGVAINAIAPGSTDSSIASKDVQDLFARLGWHTEKETILRAFDLLLSQSFSYSGKVVNAVGDTVSVQEFPKPTINWKKRAAKL